MTKLTVETLLTIGFRDIGRWTRAQRESSLDYVLDSPNAKADGTLLDARNSLYAFVIANEVKYIGKTAWTVRERFVGYRNPGSRQRTNMRNNHNIRDALASGGDVRILVFNPTPLLRYSDFEINLAAGLEDALIEAFNPPWNGKYLGRPLTEEAEREQLEGANIETGSAPTIVPVPRSTPLKPSMPRIASFQIVLGEAYYNQGLINPGVKASAYLGNDGEPITVIFEDGSEPVRSQINRKANLNGSVRVVGRNQAIAGWFQAHFRKGDTVEAHVLDSHRILLCSAQQG